MMKIIIASTFLFTTAVCNATDKLATSTQPLLADYSVGEKWVWKFKGVTTEGEIRANGIDKKIVTEHDGKLFLSGENGKVLLADIVKPNTSPTPRFDWPLEVNKKWLYEESWASQDGTTGKTSQQAEVISFKVETVDAGTFMAYTIKYSGKITNSRGYSAKTEEVFWYAPAVKNFIKLTQIQDNYIYEEELVEYVNPK